MYFALFALITAVLGIIPILILKRYAVAIVTGVISFFILWGFYYLIVQSMVWPLGGAIGVIVLIFWVIIAFAAGVNDEDNFKFVVWFPIILVVLFIGRGCAASEWVNPTGYASLIGTVEKEEWTQNVQPLDPKHIRLVSRELAEYLADKQLGSAPGAIGSQFKVSKASMTLQKVNGKLQYIAPLDFGGLWEWNSANTSPGYVAIDGEDPLKPAVLKLGKKFRYTPEACFGNNLDRMLHKKGYLVSSTITDRSFEIDDSERPWWVVTVYEPTIGWWGAKVKGVVILDPDSGKDIFYPLGKIPEWIDRAIPEEFVEKYISYYGKLSGGYWNQNKFFGAKLNLTEPETPFFVYGADGKSYWSTGVTSTSVNDQSTIGYMYTDARTGKSKFFHAVGATDEAVVTAVDNKVAYKKWHGTSPTLYNIYGKLASIVPLLGENHTFQGVAIVDISNMQVALGDNELQALREYQKMISSSGEQIAPEMARQQENIEGVIDRCSRETKGSETIYYLYIKTIPHTFTGSSELSPAKLPITEKGDRVKITYIASEEDVQPMLSFDNFSISIKQTQNQEAVKKSAEENKKEVEGAREVNTFRKEVQKLSDEDIKKILEKKK